MTIEGKLIFLKGYSPDLIVEADLKLIKNSFPAKKIEANSKTLRKPDWSFNLKFSNMNAEIVKISRDVTAISYYNHLEPAILDIDSHTSCCLSIKDTKHGPRVNINPYLFVKNGNGNYWH